MEFSGFKLKKTTQEIILTKDGKINKSVKNMLDNCQLDFKGRKIRTGYYLGSGRYTTAHSASSLVESILKAQGYKFELSNDAPRSGVKGDYIKVGKQAMEFISKLSE